MVIFEGDTASSLLRSTGTDTLKLVKLYFVDSLKISYHSVVMHEAESLHGHC